MTEAVSWHSTKKAPPTLAALRAYVLEVSKDLDPGSRYVKELLATLDASRTIEEYSAKLTDPDATEEFKKDGARVSTGVRGFSWVDSTTWGAMDVWERTLANLLTGETRMMWAG